MFLLIELESKPVKICLNLCLIAFGKTTGRNTNDDA